MKNIFVQWQIDDTWLKQARFYNEAMVEVKQIKQAPDLAKLVNTQMIGAVAREK